MTLVTELLIGVDNCFRASWKGIDGFMLEGYSTGLAAAFEPNVTFVYTPTPYYYGNDAFSFYLTDCIGDSFRKTDALTLRLNVTHGDPDLVRFSSVQFLFSSVQFGSVRFVTRRVGSGPVRSVPFSSVHFGFARFVVASGRVGSDPIESGRVQSGQVWSRR